MRGGGGVFALEVQSLGEAFESSTRLSLGEGELESTPSTFSVAFSQGRATLFDQGRAHLTMMA
jgi:hypothetical protein